MTEAALKRLLDKLAMQTSMRDARDSLREPERIVLSPAKQREVNEILEDYAMREARNALIAIGHPGWKQKGIMGTEGLIGELRAAAPEVAEELEYRLRKGRSKVLSFDVVRSLWPEVRERLLKDGNKAQLGDLRTGYSPREDIIPSVPGGGTIELR